MQANDDPHFQARATTIKEERAEPRQAPRLGAVERLLQAAALREVPELHQLVNDALKALSAAKASTDPATGQKALDYIAQIDKIFWETKKA